MSPRALGRAAPAPAPAPRSQSTWVFIRAGMEALGPGGLRASPSSSTGSLDLRRLSVRADSAYSSFSTDSGCPEPRSLSPGTDLLPYLDGDYVRVVWGGQAPGAPAGLQASSLPRPASSKCSAPGLPQVAGPLSKQATPLLYALAAEAEATARAAEPPSPPASRAAYRQRLQGAQRRVLRETSFQRKELRMSLPARLRPSSRPAASAAASAEPSTGHSRSSSLSHSVGAGKPTADPAAANQQKQWCFSEPGKLDRVGQGSGLVEECASEACSSPGFSRPEPQELQKPTPADFRSQQFRWLPKTQLRSAEDPEPGPQKLSYRPTNRSRSASSEGLDPRGDPGGAKSAVQAAPQEAETSRPLSQIRHPRLLTQKEVVVECSAEHPQSSPADCKKRVSETCTVSVRLSSVPNDDEVFLEEAPLARMRAPADSHASPGLPLSVHTSDQKAGVSLGQSADQAADPFQESPEMAGEPSCWHELSSSVHLSRATCYSPTGTVNGDTPTTELTELLTTHLHAASESESLKPLLADAPRLSGSDTPGSPGQAGFRPAWLPPCLEELVQELARLDPSLSETFTIYSNPEPLLALLDGLIPLPEVRAAMRPAYGEVGEETAVTSESGSYLFSSTQLLSTSQEETRPENLITHPVLHQPGGQDLPELSNQTKKAKLVDLLERMLQALQTEQRQLQRATQAWAQSEADLQAVVGHTCAPRELERFRRFMADLERVLSLLLLLGSRLARVHCAQAQLDADSDPDEQASVLQRLQLLQRQQEDSQELKEHVARRERVLREVLVSALPEGELCTYSVLLARRAALLAQQRSLDECVRLLQDQLDALRSDLGQCPPSFRPSWPSGTRSRDRPPIHPLLI